jgi:hypothetical protein
VHIMRQTFRVVRSHSYAAGFLIRVEGDDLVGGTP